MQPNLAPAPQAMRGPGQVCYSTMPPPSRTLTVSSKIMLLKRVSSPIKAFPAELGVCGFADGFSRSALREQLLAQVQNHHRPPHRPDHQLSHTANAHHHNIDPAIAGSGMINAGAGDSGGDENGSDGRKSGKRELSTSKRAAQNRAAQVRGLWFVNPSWIDVAMTFGVKVSCRKIWVTKAAY